MPPLTAAEIPPITASGSAYAQTDAPTLDAGTHQCRESMQRIADMARQP